MTHSIQDMHRSARQQKQRKHVIHMRCYHIQNAAVPFPSLQAPIDKKKTHSPHTKKETVTPICWQNLMRYTCNLSSKRALDRLMLSSLSRFKASNRLNGVSFFVDEPASPCPE